MKFQSFTAITAATLLTGCVGGGGTSTTAQTSVEVTGSSTLGDAAAANTDLQISGISNVATFSRTSTAITSVGSATLDTTSEVVISLDENTDISGIEVTTDSGTFTWGESPVSNTATLFFVETDGSSEANFSNSIDAGLDYLQFGAWLTGLGQTDTSGKLGTISAGNITTGTSIPATGTKNFSGYLLGYYVDTNGEPFKVGASNVTLGADFSARSVTFTSTNTTAVSAINENTNLSNPSNLNMTGTFTYSAATNTLTSTDIATTSGLTGSANAQFYGPNADEVGGVFSVSDSNQRFDGAFGAK